MKEMGEFGDSLQQKGNVVEVRNIQNIFGCVKINCCFSYNPATGEFTAPVDGVYYFSVYLHVRDGKEAWFKIVQPGGILCETMGISDSAGDGAHTGCSGTVRLNVGEYCKVCQTHVDGEWEMAEYLTYFSRS